jgi:hypothetical protein
MTTLQLVLIAVFGLLGTAKVVKAPSMVRAASELGFTSRQYQLIGCLELLAVGGLVVGFWWPPASVAADVGLLVLMLGALLAHLRHQDGARRVLPAVVVLGLAAGFLALQL